MTVVDLPAIPDAGRTILDWADQPPHAIYDWYAIAHALQSLENPADLPTQLGPAARHPRLREPRRPGTCEALRDLASALRLPHPRRLQHAQQLALPLNQ